MIKRKAYLLTCDENSERAIFCKNLLTKIGFDVTFFKAIPHENPVISHKQSSLEIYRLISIGEDEWVYVFEDDINVHYDITLEEIVKYEEISNGKSFFYLGCCIYKELIYPVSDLKINNHKVGIANGNQRGSHAMAFSKTGANKIFELGNLLLLNDIDVIHDIYTSFYPTYIIRYDLESYIEGHIGVFYQDRNKFKAILHTYDCNGRLQI